MAARLASSTVEGPQRTEATPYFVPWINRPGSVGKMGGTGREAGNLDEVGKGIEMENTTDYRVLLLRSPYGYSNDGVVLAGLSAAFEYAV